MWSLPLLTVILALASASHFAKADDLPSADAAIALLNEGNRRFATGQPQYPHDGAERRAETSRGQHPFATIVSCSDSRVPPEILFDEGIGDLFVVRVIGNVGSVDETGSAEYGVEHLETPLLVVLGHTNCGAVTAAAMHSEVHGSIPPLLKHIDPAVRVARRDHPHARGDELVAHTVRTNVLHAIEELFQRSRSIRHRVRDGKLKVVGAIYDIETGVVSWLGEHPRQAQLLQGRRQGR